MLVQRPALIEGSIHRRRNVAGGIGFGIGAELASDDVDEHFDQITSLRLLLKLLQRATKGQFSVVQQAECRTDALRLFQPMRAQNYGLALIAEQIDMAEDDLASDDIQSQRRFVKDHHAGIVNHGSGKIDPLLFTGAQRRTATMQELAKAQQIRQLFDPGSAIDLRHAVNVAEEAEHFMSGQPLVDTRVRRHKTDAAFYFLGLLVRPIAMNFRVAKIGLQQAKDHPHRRRFSGSVGAQQTENFAFCHAKRNRIRRHDVAIWKFEMLGQLVDIDDSGHKKKQLKTSIKRASLTEFTNGGWTARPDQHFYAEIWSRQSECQVTRPQLKLGLDLSAKQRAIIADENVRRRVVQRTSIEHRHVERTFELVIVRQWIPVQPGGILEPPPSSP